MGGGFLLDGDALRHVTLSASYAARKVACGLLSALEKGVKLPCFMVMGELLRLQKDLLDHKMKSVGDALHDHKIPFCHCSKHVSPIVYDNRLNTTISVNSK